MKTCEVLGPAKLPVSYSYPGARQNFDFELVTRPTLLTIARWCTVFCFQPKHIAATVGQVRIFTLGSMNVLWDVTCNQSRVSYMTFSSEAQTKR